MSRKGKPVKPLPRTVCKTNRGGVPFFQFPHQKHQQTLSQPIYNEECGCTWRRILAYTHYMLVYDTMYMCLHACVHTPVSCKCVCVFILYREQYTSKAQRPFGPHIIHLSLTGLQRPIAPFYFLVPPSGPPFVYRMADRRISGALLPHSVPFF